jgi:hypothetical protein
MKDPPRIDELRLIGDLLLECLRRIEGEPLILQFRDEDLCRLTFPARGSWNGPRTFRGRGTLQDATLGALMDAVTALRAQRPSQPRPPGPFPSSSESRP